MDKTHTLATGYGGWIMYSGLEGERLRVCSRQPSEVHVQCVLQVQLHCSSTSIAMWFGTRSSKSFVLSILPSRKVAPVHTVLDVYEHNKPIIAVINLMRYEQNRVQCAVKLRSAELQFDFDTTSVLRLKCLDSLRSRYNCTQYSL